MNKITPEKLTEKFFTDVLGWEKMELGTWWVTPQSETERGLPPLHESLDLQEEWVVPELLKRYTDPMIGFRYGLKKDCEITAWENMDKRVYFNAYDCKTIGLAHLEACLKALGCYEKRSYSP